MIIYCENKTCRLSVGGICKSNELKLEMNKPNSRYDCNVLVCMSHEWDTKESIAYEPIEPTRS